MNPDELTLADIEKLIDRLHGVNREALECRLGLMSPSIYYGIPRTYEEVGREFGVTRQKAWVLVGRAIDELGEPRLRATRAQLEHMLTRALDES